MGKKIKNKESEFQACADVCGILSEIFQRPENATQERIDLLIKKMGVVAEQIGQPFGVSPIHATDEFRKEFARMFFGLGEPSISLVGSEFLDAKGEMKQLASLDVTIHYSDKGLPNELPLVDDHFAVEMKFVQKLIEKSRTKEAAEFLFNYVLPWLPLVSMEIMRLKGSFELFLFTNLVCAAPQLVSKRLEKAK